MSRHARPSEALRHRTVDRFWETVPLVWNHIRRNVRSIAVEHFGITVEQFHILRHIFQGASSVSQLAEAKQISRPAISQAVDVLVGKGLISRRPNAEDRRYVHVELTAAGKDLMESIFRENHAWMLERMAPLSVKELDNLLSALESLKSSFDQPNA